MLTLVLGLVVGGSSLQAQHTAAEQYLFDAVNNARIAAGLTALTWSDGLTRAAADHAERMRKEDALSHQFEEEADLPERVAATGVRFSIISENVGVSESAIELHTAWIQRSPPSASRSASTPASYGQYRTSQKPRWSYRLRSRNGR